MSYTQPEDRNRSTWLASLWLQNTSEEVYSKAVELAKDGNQDELKRLLLADTGFADEEDKHTSEINWPEVIEDLTDNA